MHWLLPAIFIICSFTLAVAIGTNIFVDEIIKGNAVVECVVNPAEEK